MKFAFTNDQRDFAAALKAMLANEFPAPALRSLWETGDGHSATLWAQLAEMGVLSALVPEANGGLGMSMTDTVLLFTELGRAAAPGPVIEHMAVAAPALAGTPIGAQLASGECIATTDLEGSPYVAHAGCASVILRFDCVLSDFVATPVDSIDAGRKLFIVTDGTMLPVVFDAPLARARGAVATAAYLVGLSEHMIAVAADYARVREQFGKPIGSFQAVKHLMADALLKVEFAKPALYKAAWGLGFEGTTPDVLVDVAMAKALASEAAYRTTRSAMQTHGAIGYTWEADLQLWMKKAWALQRAWGDAPTHRRTIRHALLGV